MRSANWGFLVMLLLGLAALSILAAVLKVAAVVLFFGLVLLFKALVAAAVIAIVVWLLGGWK